MRSLFALLLTLFCMVQNALSATTHFPQVLCGRYSELYAGIVLESGQAGGPGVGPGDEVAVLDASGNIIGATVVGAEGTYLPDQYGVVACGDDDFTEADEGASTGEAVSFLFWDSERDLEFALTPVDPYTGEAISVTWNGAMWFAPATEVYLKIQSSGGPPGIKSFTVNPASAHPGGAVELEALLDDPDRDELTYKFTATCGGFDNQQGVVAYSSYTIHSRWFAPSTEGKCFIRLKVEDPSGKSATEGVLIGVEMLDETPPEDPPALIITELGTGKVRISWEPSRSADVAEYRLYIAREGGPGKLLASLDKTRTFYEFTAGDEDEYEFTLRVVDENGNESPGVSNTWSFSEDEAPPEITVEVKGDQLWVTALDDRSISGDGLNITILDEDGELLSPQPVPDITELKDEMKVVAVIVMKPGDYVVDVRATDRAGNSAKKIVPRSIEEGLPFAVPDVEGEDEIYLQVDETRRFSIEGGKPPYSISENTAPYVVRARVRGDELVLRAREPGRSVVKIEDSGGSALSFGVGVLEPPEEEGLRDMASSDIPLEPDPLLAPLALSLAEEEMGLELSLPDFGGPVDVYCAALYYPVDGGNGILAFLGRYGEVLDEPLPVFTGIGHGVSAASIIKIPRSALPQGRYTFYTLVTGAGHDILKGLTGNLFSFSMKVDALFSGQKRMFECPAQCREGGADTCPVCASRTDGGLEIRMKVPVFSTGSVDLYLAVEDENGLLLVTGDGRLKEFSGVEDLLPFESGRDGFSRTLFLETPGNEKRFYWLITPHGDRSFQTYSMGVENLE